MKQKMAKKLACIAFAGMMLPMAVQAAEADLQLKVDNLTQEVNDLKGSVQRNHDRSLSKWLSVGGAYRFRIDNLHGETVPYTSAIGTMNNLVGGFVAGPYAVAGSSIGYAPVVAPGLTPTSPNATQFIFMGKAGSLFTPAQFETIMNSYMPQAMAQAMPSLVGAFASGAFTPANTALTAQQQSILTTLGTKVMPIVNLMEVQNIPGLDAAITTAFGGAPPAGTTVEQWMSNFTDPQKQLFNQMLMQAFLGAAGPLNGNQTNLDQIAARKPKNETLYTSKFSLDLHAKATQDVTVNVKLGMYKTFGTQSDASTMNGYFADRVGTFDGTLGHVPSSSLLNVDRAYATWSNIADQPVWFSVGRRPSTDGAPSNLRQNNPRPGNGGTPGLLVDYAFDGMTIGYAPDIEPLPGFYAKVCYGRGFESGLTTASNSVKDTDMLGVAVIPVDTDPLRVWMQWNRGFNIFDFPEMNNTMFGNTAPSTNLGSIDWYGMGAMSTLKDIGPGKLNFFVDGGLSITNPNTNVSNNAGFQGLMTGAFFAQDFNPESKTGWAAFTGVRYDLPSKTKLGFEFNHGSKNWITFAPAADDMWTSKAGTRGNVYEGYVIQELDLKPISSYFSTAFFKIGYQLYDFEYTGSNNWVGAPVKISDIKSTDLMLMAPVKKASDIYATFEVKF